MDTRSISPDNKHELEHIGNHIGGVFKEVIRRVELWPRLGAEIGRPLTDEGSIKIADRTGMRI